MPASLDPRPWSVVLLACLPACGPGLLGFDADETSSTSVAVSTDEDEGEDEDEDEDETGNGFETDGESDSEDETDTEPDPDPEPEPETTESETGDDEPASMCGCVELEPICTPDAALAMPECAALPAPCGIVNGNAEAAECVLQLLIAGEPARFAYDLTSSQGCPTGFNNWEGWFYILAPGQGHRERVLHRRVRQRLWRPTQRNPEREPRRDRAALVLRRVPGRVGEGDDRLHLRRALERGSGRRVSLTNAPPEPQFVRRGAASSMRPVVR